MAQAVGELPQLHPAALRSVETEPGLAELKRLRWFIVVVPAVGVFLFESVRHGLLQDRLPTWEGNILAAFMALAMSATFSQVLFKTIRSLHRRTLADQQELVALNAVVQERERLSRELHDGLAQVVSYMLLRLDTVEELIRSGRNAEAAAELGKMRALGDNLYVDVRESISGLRSRVADVGFMQALREYASEFEDRHGITVSLHGAAPRNASPAVEAQLFRITQEALTNVRKHSQARSVTVTVGGGDPEHMQVAIVDDGRGFDPSLEGAPRTGSFGLRCMRERAEALGGSLQIESEPRRGTRVLVQIPTRGQGAGTTHETAAAAAG